MIAGFYYYSDTIANACKDFLAVGILHAGDV